MENRQYLLGFLEAADLHLDPAVQFQQWFEAAQQQRLHMPEAMILSTVGADGCPDSRVVLLKESTPLGMVFFTNYQSPKAQQLNENPHAALTFWWPQMERQVRVRGTVSLISSKESDAYFRTRPRGSQLGAWCSPQSQVLATRKELDGAYMAAEQRFLGQEIPRPENWGGYRLAPVRFEFWQGRDNRLHDRFAYTKENGTWRCERLAP